MSNLPLINLLSKNTLSEAEEMVCSHPVSQILFLHASLFYEASPNACSQGCYGKGDKKEFVFRLALSSLWDGCWWQMSVHHLSTSVCHCLQTSSPQGCVGFVVWSGTTLPLTGLVWAAGLVWLLLTLCFSLWGNWTFLHLSARRQVWETLQMFWFLKHGLTQLPDPCTAAHCVSECPGAEQHLCVTGHGLSPMSLLAAAAQVQALPSCSCKC